MVRPERREVVGPSGPMHPGRMPKHMIPQHDDTLTLDAYAIGHVIDTLFSYVMNAGRALMESKDDRIMHIIMCEPLMFPDSDICVLIPEAVALSSTGRPQRRQTVRSSRNSQQLRNRNCWQTLG